ncbi:MAG: 4'-phosphopantetheinyl transferase superfamily protein [Proteobacteria bacterium]|nr:4'-phosphopantetheinyl transferase superfamily protein [Pseudomonadota bacterium]
MNQPLILIADTSSLQCDAVIHKGLSLVSVARQQKIQKYRFIREKALSLGAGLLLNEGLQRFACNDNPPQFPIRLNDYGKPYLANGACFFNLSHSHQKVMAIFAQTEVGCDIERVTDSNDDLVKALFDPNEKALYACTPEDKKNELFFRIWTARESFLKAIGRGLADPVPEFSTVSKAGTWVPVIVYEGRTFWGQHGLYENYVYAWWVACSP